jgi:glycosyltransferase involved in cell wall biosynthesis
LADAMIGDSDATRRRFSSSPRVTARYLTIVGGANLRRFHPADDRVTLRGTLGLPADRFVQLFVGQVKEAKGVLDIVDALPQLSAAHPPGRGPLLFLIGTPDPPGIVEEIRRRTRAHGSAPGEIARAVSELLASPERLAAMRAAGVRRARETFDIRLHARGVEAFYRELLGRSSAP